MSDLVKEAVGGLMQSYAKFFVEDFANGVLDHLKGKVPINETVQAQAIIALVNERFTLSDISVASTPAKFLYECALEAMENYDGDLKSREMYDTVKALPSRHHEELNGFVYVSAQLYQTTLDNVVLGVLGTDARNITQKVANSAQTRTSSTDTGGRVHQFTWGILSDGLWLNSALLKAFELTKTFRPGEPVQTSYAQTGFDFARTYTNVPQLSDTTGVFDLLVANTENEVFVNQNHAPDDVSMFDALFTRGSLLYQIDKWELGLKQPTYMFDAVRELSNLAHELPYLLETAQKLEQQDLIVSDVIDRINAVNNAVSLCLTSFEALRETKYNSALVLHVTNQNDDPLVDVFVNQDLLTSYLSSGGEESDLVAIGNYLDPRNGSPTQPNGWSKDWAIEHREVILTESLNQEQKRLQTLRNNDAAMIQKIATESLYDVVNSYAEAKAIMELPNPIVLKINEMSRKITSTTVDEDFSFEQETLKLLANTTMEPFLIKLTDKFIQTVNGQPEETIQDARALTIASIAIDDAIACFA